MKSTHFDFDPPVSGRIVGVVIVGLLHLAVLAVLIAGGGLRPVLKPVMPVHLVYLPPIHPPIQPPPRSPTPDLPPPPPLLTVPAPEIRLATPDQPAAPRAVSRLPQAAPFASHFGAATDTGLALDIGTRAGGGAGTRGSLAGWQAAVRRVVLEGRKQPSLAWDRRNTCIVNYRVTVGRGGRLAGFAIDPCAVSEINEAARTAIRQANYPPPPDLGGPTAEVSGTMVFRP